MMKRKNMELKSKLLLKIVSVLFIGSGVMFILYPFFTFIYSSYEQHRLKLSLTQKQPLPDVDQIVGNHTPDKLMFNDSDSDIKNNIEKQMPHALETDEAWGIIEIPAIGLSATVVSGTQPSQLKKGPGWYPNSALPGKTGNVAIAGHRSTYGAWFRHLDRLEKGDRIFLFYQNKHFIYRVEEVFLVERDDFSVIEPTNYQALTLTTCHPLNSASQRLVVRAKRE